jgi:hypothetical protein
MQGVASEFARDCNRRIGFVERMAPQAKWRRETETLKHSDDLWVLRESEVNCIRLSPKYAHDLQRVLQNPPCQQGVSGVLRPRFLAVRSG